MGYLLAHKITGSDHHNIVRPVSGGCCAVLVLVSGRHRKRSGSCRVLSTAQPFCSQAVFVCVIPVVVKANSGYLPVRRYAVVCDGHWLGGGGCGAAFR